MKFVLSKVLFLESRWRIVKMTDIVSKVGGTISAKRRCRSRPIDRQTNRQTDKFLRSEADGTYARFSRSCPIPTPSGRRSRILPSTAATTRSGILGSTTRYLLTTTTWSRCHLLVRWQCGVTRHVTDSPSPQVDERWACLPAARCPAPITTRTLAAGAPT